MKTLNLNELLPGGTAYCELKIQENRSLNLGVLDGNLMQNSVSSSGGLFARTFKNGVWGVASSPIISETMMKQTIKKAIGNSTFLSLHKNKGEITLPSRPASGEYLITTDQTKWSVQKKIHFLMELDNYISNKYPQLNSRFVSFSNLEMEKNIITSDGGSLHSMIPRSAIVIMMTIMHNDEALQHYDYIGGLGQFEDYFSAPEQLYPDIDRIFDQLSKKMDAVFAKPGTYDCILDSKLSGILSHEAIGHTTEADFVLNGSIAADYLDKEVASPIVSLIDIAHTWNDKTCPIPVYIDDEGTKAEDCIIIDNGILRNYMNNKETAQRLGMRLTGNARGYSFSDEPLVRMRNTMIVPGNSKLSDMISSIENGYYLVNPSNGQADATSEFMFGVTLGYEIKNGQIGKAIKETTISGVAFNMLKTISMISDDISWSNMGMCGKKQMIPVGMGGPSIKCKINIGGK